MYDIRRNLESEFEGRKASWARKEFEMNANGNAARDRIRNEAVKVTARRRQLLPSKQKVHCLVYKRQLSEAPSRMWLSATAQLMAVDSER
jgi:hypothetical protein